MTDIKVIKTEEEYEQILKRIEEIFNSKPNTPEGDELKYLVALVEKYEDENFPTDKPSPKATIRFRMEQWGLNAKRLIPSNDMIIHPGETLNIDIDFWMKLNELYDDELKIYEESHLAEFIFPFY